MDESTASRRQFEILDAAARIFARHGYPGTDLQFVADELGVSKGTLYRYFPSKRELFLAAVDHGMQRLKADIEAGVGDVADPLARVERAVRSYFRFFDENPQFIELIVQERAEFRDRKKPTYFQHCEVNVGPWRELFAGLIAAGRVRAMPAERVTDVVSNLVYGTMITNYFAGGEKSLESQTQEMMDVLLHGILSPTESLS